MIITLNVYHVDKLLYDNADIDIVKAVDNTIYAESLNEALCGKGIEFELRDNILYHDDVRIVCFEGLDLIIKNQGVDFGLGKRH